MKTIHAVAFSALALSTLFLPVSSGLALGLGVAFALAFENPLLAHTRVWTPRVLQASVVGLGASMNLVTVASVGFHGIAYTALGIAFTFLVGFVIQRIFKTTASVSLLLSAGTAICGGSAIAAVSPVIRAEDHEVSVSLATVFILNAAALLIFPPVGQAFNLTQTQFGLWSALAIHDTSSVVGASMQYGPEALAIATTVKLARALWIVPLAFLIGFVWNRNSTEGRPSAKKPWFVLGFLAMAALVTWVPSLQEPGLTVAAAARRALVFTLFLIGSGLTRKTLMNVGFKPFIHGVLLWLLVGTVSFYGVLQNWIQ